MPHSKDIAAYPDEFWQIVQALAKVGTIPIPFETRGAAMSWRGRFHSWRILVVRGGFESSLLSAEEFACCRGMVLKLEPTYPPREEKLHTQEPAVLKLEAPGASPVARAIQAALAQAGVPSRDAAQLQSGSPPPMEATDAEHMLHSHGNKSEDLAARFLLGEEPQDDSAK